MYSKGVNFSSYLLIWGDHKVDKEKENFKERAIQSGIRIGHPGKEVRKALLFAATAYIRLFIPIILQAAIKQSLKQLVSK